MIDKIASIVLGNSWKTSLTGYLSAIALAVMPLMTGGHMPTSEQLLMAAIAAILGRFAKDHDVSSK